MNLALAFKFGPMVRLPRCLFGIVIVLAVAGSSTSTALGIVTGLRSAAVLHRSVGRSTGWTGAKGIATRVIDTDGAAFGGDRGLVRRGLENVLDTLESHFEIVCGGDVVFALFVV